MLVDSKQGLKRSDKELLSFFRQNAVSHQVILSKVDRILFGKKKPSLARMKLKSPDLNRICQELRGKIQPGHGDGPEALGEILVCSAEAKLERSRLGISNIRWAVLAATGLSEAKRKLLPSDLSTSIPNDGVVTWNTVRPDSNLER